MLCSNRAAAYNQLKQWNNAIEDCCSALQLNSKLISVYCQRSFSFLHIERLEEATKVKISIKNKIKK